MFMIIYLFILRLHYSPACAEGIRIFSIIMYYYRQYFNEAHF